MQLASNKAPLTVAYCHCSDCRRVTGAPVAAFAAFQDDAISIIPAQVPVSFNAGVDRWFCHDCGTPIAARYDYLPGQIYVPIGIIDQAAILVPEIHCHADSALPWLHIDDNIERVPGSGRSNLSDAHS